MRSFKTIKGYLTNGDAEPEKLLFKSSTSVRIGGLDLDFDFIEEQFQVKATKFHKAGDTNGYVVFEEDMWLFDSTDILDENVSIVSHMELINSIFLRKRKILQDLNKSGNITIYCDYLTNSDISGIEIPNHCFKIYNKLGISFNLSFGYIGN
mgnify:FL=1